VQPCRSQMVTAPALLFGQAKMIKSPSPSSSSPSLLASQPSHSPQLSVLPGTCSTAAVSQPAIHCSDYSVEAVVLEEGGFLLPWSLETSYCPLFQNMDSEQLVVDEIDRQDDGLEHEGGDEALPVVKSTHDAHALRSAKGNVSGRTITPCADAIAHN
jgi:hypothetical protein